MRLIGELFRGNPRDRAVRIAADIERVRPDLLRLWLHIGELVARNDAGLARLGMLKLLIRLP